MKLPICSPIDKLLNGGLEHGCITNFYGPAASGKTNVAKCALVSAIDRGKKVVFVDTEGGFSAERLEQMTRSARKYTDRIILLEPKTWDEQGKTIRKLQALCKKEPIGLVIVDSVVALWRVTIDDSNYQTVNKELATQLSILSKIARENSIPILITNQVYSEPETGKIELSGRNIVKWWSKNLIELTLSGRTSCRIARIVRARSIPEDKEVEFQIHDAGLKDVRFRIF